MKNIRIFYLKIFTFLVEKFSVCLNRHVLVFFFIFYFDKGDNFYDFPPAFLYAHQFPSKKGSTLKRKNLLPTGAYSFLLE